MPISVERWHGTSGDMVVTLEVSHRDISALKDPLCRTSCSCSVTSDTSQSAISAVPAAPQSAPWLQHATPVGSTARQLSTAAFSAALSGNAHSVSTPSAGSSPAALVPPPVQGAHHSDLDALVLEARVEDPSAGGPSVVSRVVREDTREPGVGAREHPRRVALSAKVQPVMSCRKLEAPSNIPRASITCDISHWPMFWSKRAAPWNIPCTFVTCDTSHWHVHVEGCLEQEAHVRHARARPSGAWSLAAPIADARVHRRLELGPGGDVRDAHSLRQHPVGARRHALQHVPGVALRDAGRAAHEGVGAVADGAVDGRIGRVARVVDARPPAGERVVVAAREPRLPCGLHHRRCTGIVTLDVSQPTGIVLNALASRTCTSICVTELTSHLDRSWLNAVVTFETSRTCS